MEFWKTILLSASIEAIAAIGLFLQVRSGQFNVGMAVFVGVGGYLSGLLSIAFQLSPSITIPIGMLGGFGIGTLFAAVTLRLHHWFFAVTTLTLSLAAVSLVGVVPVLGGSLGLNDIPLVSSAFPILLSLLCAFGLAFWIDRSAIGLAVRATGDDEVLAQIFGVPVKRLRVVVFGLGSSLAALAGALQAHRFGCFQPSDMGAHPSLLLLIYVIVGGKKSVWGPVVGTFFLYSVPELIKVPAEAQLMILGGLMLVTALIMQDGVVGLITHCFDKLRSRFALLRHRRLRRLQRHTGVNPE